MQIPINHIYGFVNPEAWRDTIRIHLSGLRAHPRTEIGLALRVAEWERASYRGAKESRMERMVFQWLSFAAFGATLNQTQVRSNLGK